MVDSLVESQFVDSIDSSRRSYVDVLVDAYLAEPQLSPLGRDEFFDSIEARFELVMTKAFVEVVESDLYLSPAEADLGKTLLRHLFKRSVWRSRIPAEFAKLSERAKEYSWPFLLEPLHWYPNTKEHHQELETGILRMANIVAKVDGNAAGEAISQLRMLQLQLDQHLPACKQHRSERDVDMPTRTASDFGSLSQELIELIEEEREERPRETSERSSVSDGRSGDASQEDVDKQTCDEQPCDEQRQKQLKEALAELDSLVGIRSVRDEVKSLVNVCKLQQAREAHSMPTKPLSLHMVFTGNPGTGKTTVARIIGKIFGGLGVLSKGHLIETDRSGLVADYQGQSASKTSELVDSALDGVLFIDEAYALAPDGQPDSYGQEAIGTLLKRMEDERHRLVVILAGYDQPMEQMLKSNPGLSSRFSRNCRFDDYDAKQLCQIFERMAAANHYTLDETFRDSLARLLADRVATKDEHFGNGRMVRNLFEAAIRNLANRVVESSDLTPETLSTFQASDLSSEQSSELVLDNEITER